MQIIVPEKGDYKYRHFRLPLMTNLNSYKLFKCVCIYSYRETKAKVPVISKSTRSISINSIWA